MHDTVIFFFLLKFPLSVLEGKINSFWYSYSERVNTQKVEEYMYMRHLHNKTYPPVHIQHSYSNCDKVLYQ